MRKNIFIDANIGNAIKKFGIYFAVFVISFGFVSSLRNAGGTYAAQYSCPSNYDYLEEHNTCCPSGVESFQDGWAVETCIGKYDEATDSCPAGYEKKGTGVTGNCTANPVNPTLTTQKYNLTFYLNGGKMTVSGKIYAADSAEFEVSNGGTMILPTPTYLQEGKVFSHWSYVGSESMGTPISYNGNYTLTVIEDAVLTAVWEDDTTIPTEYSVTLNPNGGFWSNGTQTNKVVEYTGSKSLSDAVFAVTKNGFELCGWIRSSDNKLLTNEIDEEENGLTLTAKWCTDDDGNNNEGDNSGEGTTPGDGGNTGGETTEPEKTKYTIEFHGNGGTIYKNGTELTTTVFAYSKDNPTRIELSDYIVEKEGKEFIGWCVGNSTCNDPKIDGTIDGAEDVDLYAQFKDAVNTNKNVMFNLIGGTLYKNGRKTTTNAYQLTSLNYADYKAEKEGYEFIGWRTTGESCEKASLNKKVSNISDKLNLYACYKVDSDIEENPPTGSGLLYIAYLVAILALGYTGYYSYRVIKSRN